MNKKKEYKESPWLQFYDEEGIPAHIEYPDCSMVDMIVQSAEKWPDNIAPPWKNTKTGQGPSFSGR